MKEPSRPEFTDGETCWTLIRAAADGSHSAVNEFANRYEPVVRKCLQGRWVGSSGNKLVDDAVQEVFVECIRPGGVLARAESGYPGGFRAFLYGVVRNVMRRFEARPDLRPLTKYDVMADESSVGQVFDREFARAIMKEASVVQARMAEARGTDSVRRVELLRARFHDNMPIREIAKQWDVDPAWLHREYAKARDEFRAALLHVIATQQPLATDAENERTCQELLGML